MPRRKTLREKVEKRIARKGDPVFLPREFVDLGGEDQILRALRELVRDRVTASLRAFGFSIDLRHPCTTCRDTACRARVTPEGLLGLREIEKDFPALVEVLKRFLDFGNRIDRGHRNGQRAGGDEGSCLDLRGEHLGDMVVVA